MESRITQDSLRCIMQFTAWQAVGLTSHNSYKFPKDSLQSIYSAPKNLLIEMSDQFLLEKKYTKKQNNSLLHRHAQCIRLNAQMCQDQKIRFESDDGIMDSSIDPLHPTPPPHPTVTFWQVLMKISTYYEPIQVYTYTSIAIRQRREQKMGNVSRGRTQFRNKLDRMDVENMTNNILSPLAPFVKEK